jgi:hypothetical protein
MAIMGPGVSGARVSGRLRLAVAIAATSVVAPMAVDHADAAPAKITAQSFGMHWLDTSHPYPAMPFGSARMWDMGVKWVDLQPSAPAVALPAGVEPPAATAGDPGPQSVSGWDPNVLSRLDSLVDTFRSHGADPMITLGMTPAWAARDCQHVIGGVDWGRQTCAPKDTSIDGPWGRYVRTLAARYQGKVKYFELWNEPSLHNGYNDSIALLGQMTATAHAILHSFGELLVAPSIVFTNGSPKVGLSWLTTFLNQAGARSFDVAGFHLYADDKTAHAGWGPEWVMGQLAAARRVLARFGMHVPVWDTEVNVGRVMTHTTFSGTAGAAEVARTFLLNLENGVQRTYWYAADDRSWGGTWMESSNFHTLTPAGLAERTLYGLLVGARPYGCARKTVGAHRWNYICRFRLANGKTLRAVWTTGRTFRFTVPRGTQSVRSVTNGRIRGKRLRVGSAPVYVIGRS